VHPNTAAKLIEFSDMRERWLTLYPEISEHLLARELGI
jgi:hypothetical protein